MTHYQDDHDEEDDDGCDGVVDVAPAENRQNAQGEACEKKTEHGNAVRFSADFFLPLLVRLVLRFRVGTHGNGSSKNVSPPEVKPLQCRNFIKIYY